VAFLKVQFHEMVWRLLGYRLNPNLSILYGPPTNFKICSIDHRKPTIFFFNQGLLYRKRFPQICKVLYYGLPLAFAKVKSFEPDFLCFKPSYCQVKVYSRLLNRQLPVEIRAIPDTVNELPTRIMHVLRFILHRDCIHQHVTHT
jgi:hypothetical protein